MMQRTTTSPITGGESTARNTTSSQMDKSSDDEEDSECSVMHSAFKPISENFEVMRRITLDMNDNGILGKLMVPKRMITI